MSEYYLNTLHDRISSLVTRANDYGYISKEYLSQIIPKDISSGVYEIIWDNPPNQMASYPIRLHKIRIEDYVWDGSLENSTYIKLHYIWDGESKVNDRILTRAQLIKFDISKYRNEQIDSIIK